MKIARRRQTNPFLPDPKAPILSANDFHSLKTDIIAVVDAHLKNVSNMPKHFASGTKPHSSKFTQNFAHGYNLRTKMASQFVIIVSVLAMFHSIAIFGLNQCCQHIKASIKSPCKAILISNHLITSSCALETSLSLSLAVNTIIL